MTTNSIPKERFWTRNGVFSLTLLVLTAILSVLMLVLPLSAGTNGNQLALGDVADQDILAPYALSFQSEVLTEIRQQEAASNVPPQYTQPDPNIARQQLNHLRDVLDYIDSVRADDYATQDQKFDDLEAIQSIQLQPENINLLISMSSNEWQTIRLEANRILEQVMRSAIQENQLGAIRDGISNQVSLSLQTDKQMLVVDLVSAFITPNSWYSEELTEEMRQAARIAVAPVVQSYLAGESIVPRGHVITNSDVEALEQFGLMQPEITWKDAIEKIAIVVINFVFVSLYFTQRPDLRQNSTSQLLMAILFLIFLFIARTIIPGHTIIPYLLPVAAFGMLIAALVSSRAAIILSVALAILSAFEMPNSLELTLYYLFTSAFGILLLRNISRVLTFFWAGLGVAASGAVVLIAFRIADPTLDMLGLLQLLAAVGFNGIASASLTVILQYLLAQILGLTTTLQLMEISRPDHPLLKDILRNAPGTYQHSLQIANLAEQAAERIGANSQLTRVGALYHDAGKLRYPIYFIENQVPGSRNPHDDLPPIESARIIIQHVADGVELVKKYRLPKKIQDFVREHHGTMLTRYQYANAVKEHEGDAQAIDKSLFTYPGPKPQSRETGLLMLADGVEARARAERPDNQEAIRTLIKEVVNQRLSSGQLNETDLTLKDIEEIIDSFTTTLRGVYHPRIEYPKIDDATVISPRRLIEEDGGESR
ncbi:MAG: HDIG domain-containing protein [Anaerolineales bacterium]|nr:HDIG domain-containing protein [Anaerolineales bacterium]